MSKPMTTLDITVRVVFLALIAFLTLTGIVIFVLLVFIPVITWYVWRLLDRTKELEARLSALEGPSGKKPPAKQDKD